MIPLPGTVSKRVAIQCNVGQHDYAFLNDESVSGISMEPKQIGKSGTQYRPRPTKRSRTQQTVDALKRLIERG
jgi:hypothetical protein